MRKIFASSLLLALSSCSQPMVQPDAIKAGKRLAFERSKGNCLACHVIEEGEQPGNIGQPLTAIASRFPDKQQLRAIIWDATVFNPDSAMPPFGRNKILTEAEMDRIVDYLWSLE